MANAGLDDDLALDTQLPQPVSRVHAFSGWHDWIGVAVDQQQQLGVG